MWVLRIKGVKQKVSELKNNDELGIWKLYLFALKSPLTREKYQKRMEKFFDFIGLKGKTIEEKSFSFVNKSEIEGNQWVFNNILKFMLYQIDRVNKKEIVGSTVQNYVKSIKLFCEMADINVQWKKITRGLPKGKSFAEDIAPTIEEIRQLVQYPDRRLNAVVCTMISSGIRLAAWDDLKFKHILPIENEGVIVSAKIIVYPGSDEQYYSFITPEAYEALLEWKNFRQINGEDVTSESWILRNLWDVTTPSGGPRGLVSVPKKLMSKAKILTIIIVLSIM